MRESMGSVFLYNVIILFIIITFAFLSGTLSYVKAFKANSRIVNAIEKHEGYNAAASTEISNVLTTLGYKMETPNCKESRGNGSLLKQIGEKGFLYCIYYFPSESTDGIEYYGVQTYMYFDLPVIGNVRIPLYAKTAQMYRF